jgi:hypothetical protein
MDVWVFVLKILFLSKKSTKRYAPILLFPKSSDASPLAINIFFNSFIAFFASS